MVAEFAVKSAISRAASLAQLPPISTARNQFRPELAELLMKSAISKLVAPVPYRQNKHALFGQQEGRCNGRRSEFPFRTLEVDHTIPPRRRVAKTTLRTCSCSAPAAIGSRAIGYRNTSWPGCGSWGLGFGNPGGAQDMEIVLPVPVIVTVAAAIAAVASLVTTMIALIYTMRSDRRQSGLHIRYLPTSPANR